LGNAYMLAFAQASLGGHGPAASLGSAFSATLRNLLPLVGFFLVAAIVGFVLLMIFGVLAGLFAMMLGMVSQALAVAVMIPLYLGLVLLLQVVMYGFYYHAWREIFGEPASLPADALEA
jgi:uncharacterized protein YjeT (DUF2065 family)